MFGERKCQDLGGRGDRDRLGSPEPSSTSARTRSTCVWCGWPVRACESVCEACLPMRVSVLAPPCRGV